MPAPTSAPPVKSRPEKCRRDEDAVGLIRPSYRRDIKPDRRNDDGGEHHLEHRPVAEAELRGQFARTGEAGILQHVAEQYAAQQTRGHAVIVKRKSHAQTLRTRKLTAMPTMKNPIRNRKPATASGALPDRPTPLVQPRASRAPKPVSTPPPSASAMRPLPPSAARRQGGPGTAAGHAPPARAPNMTPTISQLIQLASGLALLRNGPR